MANDRDSAVRKREELLQTAQDSVEEKFPNEAVILVVGSRTTGLAILFSDIDPSEAALLLRTAADDIIKRVRN